MYHIYLNQAAGIYLFLYFLNFLSLKFQNIKFFITLFCKAYKVKTSYTHGQIVDLLCTPTTTSQNILVPSFFFFFLSLQLAKIKTLLLQNCFNIPLMATAVGMWALLTLCYICMCVCVNFCVRQRFLRNYCALDFENWYKFWVWLAVLWKRESASCCLSFPLFVIFLSLQ